jgi:hypothetical protein
MSIPHKPRQQHTVAVDYASIEKLRAEGKTYRAIAELLSSNYTAVYRAHHAPPANGVPTTRDRQLPAIRPSQPIAVHRIDSAVPSQPIASAVDDLTARVATLEAFMSAMQAEHRSLSQSIALVSPSIAIHRSEPPTWVSRGLQVATDMLSAIDAYAIRHRLEKREVVDLALRRLFAEEGRGHA